jgi:hypothetical protein
MTTWNVRSLYRSGGLRNELRKYKIVKAAIQETRWTLQVLASNDYNIYTSSLTNRHEFRTTFFVDSKVTHLVTNLPPINDRLCISVMQSKIILDYSS